MNFNKSIKISDSIFSQEIDGEMVLLDRESTNYFGLDTVGSTIWKIAQESSNLEEIYRKLIDIYDVSAEILEKDLANFINQLEQNNIIEVEDIETKTTTR
jgi:hypothetical protein